MLCSRRLRLTCTRLYSTPAPRVLPPSCLPGVCVSLALVLSLDTAPVSLGDVADTALLSIMSVGNASDTGTPKTSTLASDVAADPPMIRSYGSTTSLASTASTSTSGRSSGRSSIDDALEGLFAVASCVRAGVGAAPLVFTQTRSRPRPLINVYKRQAKPAPKPAPDSDKTVTAE